MDMDTGAMRQAGSEWAGADRARRMEFGNEPGAPGRARQLVAELLDSDALVEPVRLVVSELVTNVVQHTVEGGELRLRDGRPQGPVRVEVIDRDRAVGDVRPACRRRGGQGGQGLRIVERATTRWGVGRVHGGKVVWAEFA